ncbi:MAG: TIGR02147 family protein [Fibrobacteria bacterium]
MGAVLPDIVGYAEYRSFLKDRYLAMKAREPKFSHRYINAKVGAHSSGWISDILAGRQKLRSDQVKDLAAAFRLDERERDFLTVLVEMEKASDPEARVAAMEKWLALKGPRREVVQKDRFAFFDHWYHPVLREVLGILPFTGDYAALGAALNPPISAAQAKKAIDLMHRLDLILPQIWNRRMTDIPVLVKAPSGDPGQWNRILKALMKLAPEALDKYGREERNFSALTLSLSPQGMRQAGEEIALLRKRLMLIAEKDKAQNRVYQCLFQVFPVTQVLEVLDD